MKKQSFFVGLLTAVSSLFRKKEQEKVIVKDKEVDRTAHSRGMMPVGAYDLKAMGLEAGPALNPMYVTGRHTVESYRSQQRRAKKRRAAAKYSR